MTDHNQSSFLRYLQWRYLIVALFVLGVFIYGVGVGLYKWMPFSTLLSIKQSVHQWVPVPAAGYHGERELLQYAFTDPVNEHDLYYAPIKNLAGIREANERVFISGEGYDTAYENLKVVFVDQLIRSQSAQPVVRVQFQYQGNQHEAFAYGVKPKDCSLTRANLIIPGSGLNQSHGIANGSIDNYHYGILDALNPVGGEVFTFIKPNEDYLAWHDGAGRKLNPNFIWNWHLNRTGSYSVSYLVQSLAVTKWLKECAEEVTLAGLSQGGAAVLLNALQSQPNTAIVASGHSVLNEYAEWGGVGQIAGITQLSELYDPDTLINYLQRSKTSWLFTWGKQERGTYRIEAEESYTSSEIARLPNVEAHLHQGGHEFPVAVIRQWLKQQH